jgi:propanol-preferring alcohol dehydrogenase
LEISDVPKPSIEAGQVLLRVRACGVCRTDLHIVDGELPPRHPEIIPGHQIVGEIVDGGSSALPVGTRVGVSWMGGVDGTCRYCDRGLENLCESPIFSRFFAPGSSASGVCA